MNVRLSEVGEPKLENGQ